MSNEGLFGDFTGSATRGAAVTPADADISPFRALFIGGSGTVVVTLLESSTPITFTVQAGTLLPVAGVRVAAASTATGIVALV